MTAPLDLDREGEEIGDVLIRPTADGPVLACAYCGGPVAYTEIVTRDSPANGVLIPGDAGGATLTVVVAVSDGVIADDGAEGSLYCPATGDHLLRPLWLNLDWK